MTDEGRKYWDTHAKNYDRSMALLGRPIPRMVELAGEGVRGVARVPEVAAGTGLVTPALAAAANDVVATDYSAAMVATLQRRVGDAGLTNVRFEQADLYALRFEPHTFDAVVARSPRCSVSRARAGASSCLRIAMTRLRSLGSSPACSP